MAFKKLNYQLVNSCLINICLLDFTYQLFSYLVYALTFIAQCKIFSYLVAKTYDTIKEGGQSRSL